MARLLSEGRPPTLVMESVRRERTERFRGVGRNDPCPCGSGRKFKACCAPRLR
ncbi:MAG: SEC-C metal-binding domain-containing protein [Fimbriimonadales bacterium]